MHSLFRKLRKVGEICPSLIAAVTENIRLLHFVWKVKEIEEVL